MASNDDAASIARLKLGALRRQNDELSLRYAAIEQRLDGAQGGVERLRVLREGLRGLVFAQSPLHPDVDDLDAVLLAAEHGLLPDEELEARVSRAERELFRGKARAPVAYLAGRCLAEHATRRPRGPEERGAEGDTGRQRAAFERSLVEAWSTEGGADVPAFRARFEALARRPAEGRRAAREFAKRAAAPVEAREVSAHLNALSRPRYKHPDASRRAREVAQSETMVAEYAGALTILLNDIEGWGWPEGGAELRGVWVNHKWRPYLDLDLLPWLAAEILGSRWGACLRHTMAERFFPFGTGDEGPGGQQAVRNAYLDQMIMPWLPAASAFAAGPAGEDDYGAGGQDVMQKLFLLLNAELRTAQARGQTPHVLRTDILDFYNSLPHSTVRALLELYGVPEPWLGAWLRALTPPCVVSGERVRPMRGIPLNLTCSRVVAELLLRALDAAAFKASGVRLLRVNDDIAFVAPSRERAVAAWGAIRAFVAECGLSLNASKSGAVTVGAEHDGRLPAERPRFGCVSLAPDGEWVASVEAVESLRKNLASRLADASTVLEAVASYNAHLRHLLSSHNLYAPLGPKHFDDAARHAALVHTRLRGEQGGVVRLLRERLRASFADSRDAIDAAPDAWFYWPVDLGGLGLCDPLLTLHSYARGAADWSPPSPPNDAARDEHREARWGTFFSAWLSPVTPQAPRDTPHFETLLSEFTAQRGEGHRGGGADEYDRWVAYQHGPAIRERYGDLRLIAAKLVPLHAAREAAPAPSPRARVPPDDDIPF